MARKMSLKRIAHNDLSSTYGRSEDEPSIDVSIHILYWLSIAVWDDPDLKRRNRTMKTIGELVASSPNVLEVQPCSDKH
jgi:hypothetical protein